MDTGTIRRVDVSFNDDSAENDQSYMNPAASLAGRFYFFFYKRCKINE